MKKLTVLCDFDDVLINFCEVWVQLINEQNGTEVKITDVKDWEISKAFPTLTLDQIYRPLHEVEIWNRVVPLPGAVEYLQKLKDDGHKVYIVTSSHYSTIETKIDKVLVKYFPFIDVSDVIVTRNKQMVHGDVLIDDGMHNLCGGTYKGILMTQPHNESYDLSKPEMREISRANGWSDIYSIITALSQGGNK